MEILEKKSRLLQKAREIAATTRLEGQTLGHAMKHPEFHVQTLPPALLREVDAEIWELLETELKYEGYIRRAERAIASDAPGGIGSDPRGDRLLGGSWVTK